MHDPNQNKKAHITLQKEKYTYTRNTMEGPANWKNLAQLWSHQTFTKEAAPNKQTSRQNTNYTNLGCKKSIYLEARFGIFVKDKMCPHVF